MWKVYSVTYDLRVLGHPDYQALEEELKSSTAWWHYLESTWLIYTWESAQQLSDRLLPHIRQIDLLLVIEVTPNSQGWLPKAAWDWINQHVPSISRQPMYR